MKKFFYSFFVAVATMFAVTSCSQEEVVGNEVSGNEVEVTFNATMEGQAVSRAIGDGLTVDQLLFAVYDENGEEITNLRQNDVAVSKLGATVNVRLVKGQTYQFVFWAQKSGAGHYDTSNMKAIKVNDYRTLSNDESRDAFYTFVGKTKVTGPFSQDVTLKRPFAQLNLGTTAQDWGWAQTAGVTITDSKVKVTGEVYSTLNTFDGTVAGETPVEFTLNAIPSQGDLLVTDNKSYYYLSTNYLLAPADKSLSEEIVFTLNAGANPINELKVYNAPLQRNWRTNIVGEILTGEGTFNITVDPIFDGDRNYDMPGSELVIPDGTTPYIDKGSYYEVYTAKGLLKWAYMANKANNTLGLKLMNDITLPAYTIEADATNETYVYTEIPITVDATGKPSGSNWIPVRNNSEAGGKYFEGVIDGNNFSIYGLTINYTSVTAGLVGYMEGGTIKNLTLNNANVYSTQAYTGGFVGYNEDNSTIENCHLLQSKVVGKLMVGGIVGSNWTKDNLKSSAVIKSCTTDQASIIKGHGTTAGNGGSMRGVGGIAGQNWGGIILNCTNNATINGISYIGGIVGSTKPSDTQQGNSNGYIIGCVNNGNVAASSGNVGGIAGENMSANSLKSFIVGCSSSASSITGSTKGLLVGSNSKCFVYASWAKAINAVPLFGYSASDLYAEVYAWESINDISSADITAMNTQIGVYNALAGVEQCPYSWSMTSGNWPVLK